MTEAQAARLRARAAALLVKIQLLHSKLDPLRTELAVINLKLDGSRGGVLGAVRRADKVAARNQIICDQAKALISSGNYIPYTWQMQLSEKHRLSGRQIRRILKSADIKVDR